MRLELLAALNAERAARRACVLITELSGGAQRLVKAGEVRFVLVDSTANTVQQSLEQPEAFNLDSNGQTPTQESAASALDQIVSLLNTQVGNNYIFSGSAVNQPAVASTDAILNGNGAQAGLKQLISQRQQADLGADLDNTIFCCTAIFPFPCAAAMKTEELVLVQGFE